MVSLRNLVPFVIETEAEIYLVTCSGAHISQETEQAIKCRILISNPVSSLSLEEALLVLSSGLATYKHTIDHFVRPEIRSEFDNSCVFSKLNQAVQLCSVTVFKKIRFYSGGKEL